MKCEELREKKTKTPGDTKNYYLVYENMKGTTH